MNDDKVYILEKAWKLKSPDFTFNKDEFDYALIRPCNVDYKTHRNFALGKKVKIHSMIYEGCVAFWYAKDFMSDSRHIPFEQFLVDANTNKIAIPLFENWVFEHDWHSYTVKTIDLKTNEVLYDATKLWLSERRRKALI